MRVIKFCRRIVRRHGVTFIVGFLCALGLFVVINIVIEHTSDPEFCGALCHEMNTSYTTWELSVHGANKFGVRTECIDCHLPPKDGFFTHLAVKSYAGAKDGYKHFFGGEYDRQKMRKKVIEHMSSQICLHCHDSLLAKPASSASRTAHLAALTKPDEPQNRCVECHEDVGHERQNTLFHDK